MARLTYSIFYWMLSMFKLNAWDLLSQIAYLLKKNGMISQEHLKKFSLINEQLRGKFSRLYLCMQRKVGEKLKYVIKKTHLDHIIIILK